MRSEALRAATVCLVGLALVVGCAHLVILAGGSTWGAELQPALAAARRLLDGGSLYAPEQLAGPYAPNSAAFFLHPPPFIVAILPLALTMGDASTSAAAWIWAAAAATIVVGSGVAIARAEDLDTRLRGSGGRTTAVLGLLAVFWAPVVAAIALGSAQPILLGLLALAWLQLRQHEDTGHLLAGVSIAGASLIAPLAGLLVLWLLLRPRLRTAVWAKVWVPLLAVIALPFTGLEAWLDYPAVLLNMGRAEAIPGAVSPSLALAPFLGYDMARLVVAVAGLGAIVLVARRVRDDAASFALAIVIVVLVAPAVRLGDLALLAVPLVLALVGGARPLVVALAYGLIGVAPALGALAPPLTWLAPTAGCVVLVGALLLGPNPMPGSLRPVR